MPHAFFIGSKMATMRRLHPHQYGEIDETYDLNSEDPVVERGPMLHLPQPVYAGSLISRFRRHTTPGEKKAYVAPPPEPRPTLARVRAHINHATVDIIGSLLGFAVLINSAILITAASVFYYGNGRGTVPEGVSDLFDAYDLIKEYIGPGESPLDAFRAVLIDGIVSVFATLFASVSPPPSDSSY
jgi:metal iron transporter